MLSQFNSIMKGTNKSIFEFNVRFHQVMNKFLKVTRLEENACVATYNNAFDAKMSYLLRDKDLQTIRDAFRMPINIESNIKALGNFDKRYDQRLFNPRSNKGPADKNTKEKEEDKLDKVLNALKDLKPSAPHPTDRGYQNRGQHNIAIGSKLFNHPYTIEWNNGKPIPRKPKEEQHNIFLIPYKIISSM